MARISYFDPNPGVLAGFRLIDTREAAPPGSYYDGAAGKFLTPSAPPAPIALADSPPGSGNFTADVAAGALAEWGTYRAVLGRLSGSALEVCEVRDYWFDGARLVEGPMPPAYSVTIQGSAAELVPVLPMGGVRAGRPSRPAEIVDGPRRRRRPEVILRMLDLDVGVERQDPAERELPAAVVAHGVVGLGVEGEGAEAVDAVDADAGRQRHPGDSARAGSTYRR